MFRCLAAALICVAGALAAGAVEEDLHSIRRLELDPQRCYRVRDVFLEREDLKLYFTDGHVALAKPVLGRTLAALFLATEPSDVGEVLLIPPTAAERESAARFLGETILNEKFRNAMLFFTDDTPQALEAAIRQSPAHQLDLEAGGRIAARWSTVLRNIVDSSVPRILLDLYSERSSDQGFFAAAVRGSTLGRFDIVIDTLRPEQVMAGRFVRAGGRSYYETWNQFEARSYRSGSRQPEPPAARLEDYRISVRLGTDLRLQAQAGATLVRPAGRSRAVGFEISDRLEVTSVRVAGAEVEFLQHRHVSPEHRRGTEHALVVVVLPESLREAQRLPIEFAYAGKIVTDAGSRVYFVRSRDNWYPRLGLQKTRYELEFRYPQHLDLVATGEPVEDYKDGGMRVSRFRSGRPIRMAGFNLGDYVAASREVDGFRVEVRATKTVEARLQAPRAPVVLPNSIGVGRRRGGARRDAPVLVLPNPPPANPAQGIERIADESAAAFRYFLRKFGEPALPLTVVSPVPGDFGQGFPGLVFASTLSYFQRGDSVMRPLASEAQRFYADLLRPHEIAHQWWGNVATVELDRDAWLMEALATYSSLLWLEERRGAQERNRALEHFRRNLLQQTAGQTLESMGPIVLGRRLRTARAPEAYRTIVYEKGAWVLHMLRGVLGDERFFAMLRSLCDEHRSVPVTTEGFRELAARWAPKNYRDPDLRDFFDQWVYGTGVPRLAVTWRQTSKGGRHNLTVQVQQSGVPDFFPLRVPVEVHTLPGRSLVKSVVTGDDEESARFSVVLRNPASRVVLDPEFSLLAQRP